MKFSRSLVTAFLIFPMNVMGVIPAFLVWCSRPGGMLEQFPYSFNRGGFFAGTLLIVLGIGLCWQTVSLLTEHGDGTPAPYDPPKKLVILGPYVYMRNPMMVGVWLVLSGEALLFYSVLLGLWFLVFLVLCLIFIPLWEEPDLQNRLGKPYKNYQQTVPRWIPKIPFNKSQSFYD